MKNLTIENCIHLMVTFFMSRSDQTVEEQNQNLILCFIVRVFHVFLVNLKYAKNNTVHLDKMNVSFVQN